MSTTFIAATTARNDAAAFLPQTEERLPFTIRVVKDEDALAKAVRMRQAAYGRHVPELAKTLGEPETYDREPGAVILLAESKLDGEAVGTMRIQTNVRNRLGVERSVLLPDWLQQQRLAEATRLGVSERKIGHVAKIALFKAYYQYCVETNVDWMITAARSPLDRGYEALMFQDVFPGQGFIPMLHIGNIAHRVMAFDVAAARTRWEQSGHRLFDYMIRTHHPDIDIRGYDMDRVEDEVLALDERAVHIAA
ncbi:hypothetical protein GCM10007242_46910 [Pigmentiphaga litoralis]|jgi:hypothetical protein|uniref:N-acyl amino acid synthase FeeM domain-containing protein n=1 Tax=Pigmentiphaga litoralis TaxID=516702 RepID=UPI001677FE53|nr:hypothetical protein [Pigmentiphaga litoralis]GGX34626.1 hypothetical protein GCM10007242_46910 [Pigmentiphaga litoralis]